MTQTVTAIYEDGVLRPLSPLELTEHSKVEITVFEISQERDQQSHREKVDKALADAGLLSTARGTNDGASLPLSAERRQELADLFSVGGPVSDVINEDREGH
jgi:predicted DNA-binding antitoxin AbrB/MazE fold protein